MFECNPVYYAYIIPLHHLSLEAFILADEECLRLRHSAVAISCNTVKLGSVGECSEKEIGLYNLRTRQIFNPISSLDLAFHI